jgi:3-oxoacyl-[acyl-carrier protein] reductase
MRKLEGRVALVTGGARGIGRAIATAFSEEGAAVAVADLDQQEASATAARIVAAGGQAVAIGGDLTDPARAEQIVAETVSALGGLHVLVNNAGIGTSCPVLEMSVETWQRMLDHNLSSVFYCTRAALPHLVERRYGRIINIASQLALKGGVELAHYCAAKAGVLGLTKALARELAPYGITVNAIAPGPVETDMLAALSDQWRAAKLAELPMGRFGRPDEIAPTAVLLASEDGAYYTGSTLNVSGGDVM